jgi:hypothetical protein
MEDNPAFIGAINELATRTMNTSELIKREDLVFLASPHLPFRQFGKMANALLHIWLPAYTQSQQKKAAKRAKYSFPQFSVYKL